MARKLQVRGIPAKTHSPRAKAIPEEKFPSSLSLKWSVAVLLVYFGLRLVFFSAAISEYVPPDEVTHFGVSNIFSRVFFLPENSPETYQYGLVTNIPWLYYWTMGRLLSVNFSGVPDLLFLRLLNIPFAFATIYFVWRTLRLLTEDRLSQVLVLVMMTNTLMFSFLSAFVSYDNLTNLLAAMAVYYLLAFFRTRSGDLLAVSFLCQLLGGLTKSSFLPLILVLNALLLIHAFRDLRALPGALAVYLKTMSWRRAGLALGIFLTLALNFQLYGGNYLRYGGLAPEMFQVLPPEIAMQNRLAARTMIFTLFKEGRVSKEEALAMTSYISHPGDRADAAYLVENWADLKDNRFELLGPGQYAVFWVQRMSAGIFGIFGHFLMPNDGPMMWLFAAVFSLTCLAVMVRWRTSESGRLPLQLMVIAAFYALFLMYYVNYGGYLDSGALGIALQGRYIFPVLGPIYVVACCYLLRLFRNEYARLGLAGAVCLLFLASDLPFFLLHARPEWFRPVFQW
jgi:hypothetical protein